MRNKDQILLEEVYTKKVLKEEHSPKIPDDGYANDINSNNSKIKLINNDGTLYTPFDAISDKSLKDYYTSLRKDDPDMYEGVEDSVMLADMGGDGDVVTASWPDYDEGDLRMLLYGARETGQIPSNTEVVILPDGKEFQID